jgi:NAD(P)-dependent dehydrogenase (short-subunit alcohol dehydrogenase family)
MRIHASRDTLMLEHLFGIRSQISVVLGGSSGIGKTIALGYARAGAHVVASSRRGPLVEATAGEIRALGAKTLALTCDVLDYNSVSALLDAVLAEFGRVDILVMCSGVNSRKATVDLPEHEFTRTIDTNLTGTFRANQIFGRQMIRQGKGAIINIASVAGFRSVVGMPHYSASKAGVIALTESLAAEWGQCGVRVNAIAPGPFATELNREILKIPGRVDYILDHVPMKRFGELDELVGAAIYLASDAASYVTGATLRVDGGFLARGI